MSPGSPRLGQWPGSLSHRVSFQIQLVASASVGFAADVIPLIDRKLAGHDRRADAGISGLALTGQLGVSARLAAARNQVAGDCGPGLAASKPPAVGRFPLSPARSSRCCSSAAAASNWRRPYPLLFEETRILARPPARSPRARSDAVDQPLRQRTCRQCSRPFVIYEPGRRGAENVSFLRSPTSAP